MINGKIGHDAFDKMSDAVRRNMINNGKVEFLNGKVREVRRKIAARKIANKIDHLGGF